MQSEAWWTDLVWKDGTVNTWSQHKSGAVGKESKGEVLKGRQEFDER